jgi:hypothetical protein
LTESLIRTRHGVIVGVFLEDGDAMPPIQISWGIRHSCRTERTQRSAMAPLVYVVKGIGQKRVGNQRDFLSLNQHGTKKGVSAQPLAAGHALRRAKMAVEMYL